MLHAIDRFRVHASGPSVTRLLMGLFGLFLLVLSLAVEAGTAHAQEGAPLDLPRMTGQVRSVDTEDREVHVLTGVGFALRIVVFHAGPGCEVRVGGDAAELAEVKPGSIVIVHYRRTAPPMEAELIQAEPVRLPEPDP